MSIILFEDFEADLLSIREYIKHIKLVRNVVKENGMSRNEAMMEFCSHISSFRTSKKLFEYKSIVITLYGILEKYTNLWIQEHINNLPSLIAAYDDLPELIKNNNFQLSIRLITLINDKKNAKFDGIKKEDILLKLNNCVNNEGNYSLNEEAFYPLSGNLKHLKIVEAFKTIDIDLNQVFKKNKGFIEFYSEIYNSSIENKKATDAFKLIDEIVELRNEVAHGSRIDNIFDVDEFEHYIVFLENYFRAIYESIIEKEIEYEAKFLFKRIENVKNVYKQGSVLCFEIEDAVIRKGDIIIIKSHGNHFYKKEILEIHKDRCEYEILEINEKCDIGVNLGGGININQEFYIKTNSL